MGWAIEHVEAKDPGEEDVWFVGTFNDGVYHSIYSCHTEFDALDLKAVMEDRDTKLAGSCFGMVTQVVIFTPSKPRVRKRPEV